LAGRVTPEASPGGAVTLRWPQPHTSRGLGRSHGAGMPLMTALAGAMSVPRVRLQLCGGWWPRSRGCMESGARECSRTTRVSKSERQFPAHIDRHGKTKSKLALMKAVGLSRLSPDRDRRPLGAAAWYRQDPSTAPFGAGPPAARRHDAGKSGEPQAEARFSAPQTPSGARPPADGAVGRSNGRGGAGNPTRYCRVGAVCDFQRPGKFERNGREQTFRPAAASCRPCAVSSTSLQAKSGSLDVPLPAGPAAQHGPC
jgi:hypothetical protein